MLVSAFCVESFAAVSVNNCTARSASQLLVNKKCSFNNWGRDTVTVVNNGKVPMYVYINNCFCKEIKPNGGEYSYATWSGSVNVKVYAKNAGYGTQKVIVKTTSGTIK